MPGDIAATTSRLKDGASQSRIEELLEENRLLHEEVLVSRRAAELTATLVVEQITSMEENYHELAKVNGELRAALDEIQTLRGTLPICAKCKSIRDDEGYWNRIEQYLHDNSAADFTHGLCPPCEEELYGGQEWFGKLQQKRKKR